MNEQKFSGNEQKLVGTPEDVRREASERIVEAVELQSETMETPKTSTPEALEDTGVRRTEIQEEVGDIQAKVNELRKLEEKLGIPPAEVSAAEGDIKMLQQEAKGLGAEQIVETPVETATPESVPDTSIEAVSVSQEMERKPAGPEERNRMLAAARTREELAVAWEESAGGKGRVWVNDNLVETEACARKIRAGETDGLPLDLRQQVDRIRRIEESPETPVQSIVEEGPSVTPENQPRSLEGEESYFEQFLGTVGSAAELKTYLRNHASSENTVVLWDNDGNEIRSDVFDLGSTISHVIRGDEGYTVDTLPRSRSLREAVERIKQVQSELAK